MGSSNLWRASALLLIILILSPGISAQVSSGFTINAPNSNCNPAVYTFTNSSSGISPLSYEWNFGVYPGVNSVFQNPGTTYLVCGTFNVKLVVTNGLGQKDSSVQSVTIRCSPTASFKVSDSSGCIPFSTNFTSTSLPGSGVITDYLWDFGDGYSDTGPQPGHTYVEAGCKNITLIVTNTYNCTNNATLNNVLCTLGHPQAAFTTNVANSCAAPFTSTYQNQSDSGVAPYTYQWLFQGGNPATSSVKDPVVIYPSTGNFSTTLVTIDANGCSDTLAKNGYINIASNTADFSLSALQGCAQGTINTSAIASGTPQSWSWAVSPLATITNGATPNASITFADSGSYNICLTVTYPGGCTAQKCSTVVIHPAPVANFTVSGLTNTCIKPVLITFNDQSTGTGLSYDWSFPGGTPATANTATPPVVQYNTCGGYSASLKVTDQFGCIDTKGVSNFLQITCPTALFSALPIIGCTPITSNFNSTASSGSPVAWNWDFGDTASGIANTSALQNPSHTYNTPGCYTVILTTTTAEGCKAIDTLNAGVCTGRKPGAHFSANPPFNCVNQPVYFTDSSTNTYEYTGFSWDFTGSGDFGNHDKNPSFIYSDTGYALISLIVSNYGCADTITKDNYVYLKGPTAVVKTINSCSDRLLVTLDGTESIDAQQYSWVIPNATPSSASTPTVAVRYPGPGLYPVTLLTINDTTGCHYIQTVNVRVRDVEARFTGSPLSGCAPLIPCMTNTSLDAAGFQWVVSNANGPYTLPTSVNPCLNPLPEGVYSVQLIARDSSGCTDTLTKPDYIHVAAPATNFTGTPVSGCAPHFVNFTDLSDTGGIAWTWDFGDPSSGNANTSSLQNPTHTYNNTGNYTVSLKVDYSQGCSGTESKFQYIQVTNPVASISTAVTTGCQGTQVCFTDDSTAGKALIYLWDFGDGDTSGLAAPCHFYTSSGSFKITLTVSDTIGCADSTSTTNTLNVIRPHATFIADTTTSSCPPLQVHFTNQSTATDAHSTYFWQFGDGQVSSAQNPLHIYNIAGKFDVTLIVRNLNGCMDTVTFPQYIQINGPSAYLATLPTSGCAPHYTCFRAVSTSTIDYTWNFGDGTVEAGGDSICYTYERSGTFFPELILNDGAGCIYALPVGSVTIGGATAYYTLDDSSLCNNGTVHFTDSTFGISAVKTRTWNFNDPASGAQNTSTLASPLHYFANSGLYPVIMNITTFDGCTNSYVRTVNVSPPPAISFTRSDSVLCTSNSVLFSDHSVSSAPIASRLWDFGDPLSGNANTSQLTNPTHFYANAGAYIVTLTEAADNGCSDSLSMPVTVNQGPVASFTATDVCLNSQPIIFNNTSQFASFYEWYFGDGNSSAQLSPAHSYADSGIYVVKLIAHNTFCNDTFVSQARIFPLPQASFSLPDNPICGPPFVVTIQNNSSGAIDYQWDFGNNTSSTFSNPPPVSYTTTGQYHITLKVMNLYQCQDTASATSQLYQRAIAAFAASDTCLNTQPIVFNNSSQFSDNYQWFFGDGGYSTQANPSYTYADSGIFIPRLIASNDFCRDTFEVPVTIYPVPDASFALPVSYLCGGAPATLIPANTSTGATSYLWDEGNNKLSTLVSPTISYTSPGDYVISLMARNDHLCQDTTSHPFVVYPYPVIQNVDIAPAEGCSPLTITLQANATNGRSYSWDFGDNSNPVTSTNINTTHTYTDTGTYTISLHVLSFEDCGDTALLADTIKVHIIPHADFEDSINTTIDPVNGTVIFTNKSLNADTYFWNFGDGTTSSEENPSHLYKDINNFEVILIAATNYGCVDSISKSVYVIKKSLYVPNVFAPEFGGSNGLVKIWLPAGAGLRFYHAQIFNTWGELLWESSALTEDLKPAEGWDGSYQGKLCAQDVYVWKIEATFIDGSRWLGMSYHGGPAKTIGSVTLVR